MFGLGPTELLVVFILALLVLGPEKIPAAAAQLGKAIRNFRKISQDLRDQVDGDGQLVRSFSEVHSALRDEVPLASSKALSLPLLSVASDAPSDDVAEPSTSPLQPPHSDASSSHGA